MILICLQLTIRDTMRFISLRCEAMQHVSVSCSKQGQGLIEAPRWAGLPYLQLRGVDARSVLRF